MSIVLSYLYIYAILLFSGAYFGLKAGSRISLVMGVVTGLLTLAGLIIYNNTPQFGKMFLVVLTGLLTVTFIKRLAATKKFMPAGILTIFSILAVLASLSLT